MHYKGMILGQRHFSSEIIINYAGFLLNGFIWIRLVLTWLREAKGPDLKCQCERVWSVHQKLALSLTPSSFTKKNIQEPCTSLMCYENTWWWWWWLWCSHMLSGIKKKCFFPPFFSTMKCPMGWTLKCTNRYVSLWSLLIFTHTVSGS